MIKSEVFLCEKCKKAFEKSDEASEHENKCLYLKIGQRVRFLYMITECEGVITAINEPRVNREEPTVDIETEYEITDVDLLRDGRHVFVTRENVLEMLS